MHATQNSKKMPAKNTGGSGASGLSASNESRNESCLREGGSAASISLTVSVRICVSMGESFSHVLWIEARPKISGSTIVTLM